MNGEDCRIFLEYIRQILYETEKASLHREGLSDTKEVQELADGLEYLGECVKQENMTLEAIAGGNLDSDFCDVENRLAAPAKSLQSNLKHLTWVIQRVAQGDYEQKVHMLGDYSKYFNQMIKQLGENQEQMEKAVNTDPLTSVGNRRHFQSIATELWDNKKPFSIAYIDIDGLKNCNDNYGHSEGDKYIRSVCMTLQDACYEGEYIFRIGGDEFILLSTIDNAQELNSRLQKVRMQYIAKYNPGIGYISDFSFGCVDADQDVHKDVSELLSIADEEMYEFKADHYSWHKHYFRNYEPLPQGDDEELDKTGLDNRIFEVFSLTASNRYAYLCNLETNVSRWSLQAVEDFGLPSEYMNDAGSIWEQWIHPDDRRKYRKDLDAVMSGKKSYHDIEYRVRLKNGSYVRCACEGRILKGNGENEPSFFAGMITNYGIIDQVDPVTNCNNVYAFLNEILRRKNAQKSARLLVIGLNQYVMINNSYGYEIGNRILKLFADELTSLVDDTKNVFRLDGVKFAIVLPEEMKDWEDELFERIQEIARDKIVLKDEQIRLSVSGALVFFENIPVDENTILTEITQILRQAKDSSPSILYKYTQEKAHQVQLKMLQMEAIKTSIMDGCRGFYMVYQPQIGADESIIGAECLLRWKNEHYRVVMPDEYISWLERDNSFYVLGLWILRTAVRQMRETVISRERFTLSVNVSYRQFENSNFLSDVLQILEEEDYPKERLILELTEHCQALNADLLTRQIDEFKKHSIRIAADDFGTGYSSFGLMKDMSFDIIKIDQTFVRNILNKQEDRIMIESLIQCAKALNIKVCIEGIETKEIFDVVRQYEPECYQGYLFAKPLSMEAFVQYIDSESVEYKH